MSMLRAVNLNEKFVDATNTENWCRDCQEVTLVESKVYMELVYGFEPRLMGN